MGNGFGDDCSLRKTTRPSFTPSNCAYESAFARALLTAADLAKAVALLLSKTNGDAPLTERLAPPASTIASTIIPAVDPARTVIEKD
ncbi:unannotated protein [freshwater metagenome]|uniref:Unannotated protein n=1 Tax=freshwater metagenome TaxID=449393 RepID=A0A6J6EQN5_9ZZZZ